MALKLCMKKPRDFISSLFSKRSIEKDKFEQFEKSLKNYIDKVAEQYEQNQSEPNIVTNALKPFFDSMGYTSESYTQDGQSGIDLAIKNQNGTPAVIIEAKKNKNTNEFLINTDVNKKAFHEAVLYFMREREKGNISIFHIIITDFYQFYIFDAKDFEELFWKRSDIKKLYNDFNNHSVLMDSTKEFYQELENKLRKLQSDIINDDMLINCAYFNLQDKINEKELIALYKLLSSDTLLKQFNPNDANSLNQAFYNELLYILGLEEVEENNKKQIKRHQEQSEGSFFENTLNKLIVDSKISENCTEEQKLEIVLSLLVVWLNRILFLKLVESQIVRWNDNKSYSFINKDKIQDFGELETLFFEVLAKKKNDRRESIKNKFDFIPYLNSSLFAKSKEEISLIDISKLSNSASLSYYKKTILKDDSNTRKTGKANPLYYLFDFLNAYDFSGEGNEEVANEHKQLINAAVLGLIFEKLNGYKDGSFYTPSFITMYMARESIEKAVIQKFNKIKNQHAASIKELHNNIDDIKEANEIINTLRICDPAVGSGHFLISVLNELVRIKYELGILVDSDGKKLRDYHISIENDELIVKDDSGEIFEYKKGKKELTRVQKALFEEKRNLIENMLFGVDINPNSVNICRLRLWIELLKNSYYREDGEPETLPNIDINIKFGDSLISRYSIVDDLDKNHTAGISNIKAAVKNYKEFVKDYKDGLGDKNRLETSINKLKDQFKNLLNASKYEEELKPKLKEYVYQYGYDELSETLMIQAVGFKPQPNFLSDEDKDEKYHERREKQRTILLKKIEDLNAKIDEIKNDEIYKNAFEWRFEFPEILDENGNFAGFDIIIGNPPYVQLQSMGDIANAYKNMNYHVFERTGDIYCLFYELGYQLLKQQGYLCFITSNKWMRAGYGEKTREFFADTINPEQLIDFAGVKVFGSATVDVNILMFSKDNNRQKTEACVIKKEDKDSIKDLSVYFRQNASVCNFSTSDSWVVLSPIEQRIKAKIEAIGTPLKDWDIQINYGIKTGLNEAFIISKEKKDELIKQDPKSEEIIRPILRGRDIKRYGYEFADLYLLFIPWHFPLHTDSTIQGASEIAEQAFQQQYPAIYSHLLKYKKELSNRNKAETGIRYEWYALQRWGANYWEDFYKQKIVWTPVNAEYRFALIESGWFFNNSVFMITNNGNENLNVILSVMNSKLLVFYLNMITSAEYQYGSKELFQTFPIPKPTAKLEQKIEKLLQNKDYEAIDKIIYELYQLSPEEIKFIETQ
jgi:type II restriction/modification system DNA methylase subunit YeeA